MTFSARFVLNLINVAAERGARRQYLLDLTTIPAGSLPDDDFRISVELYNRFIAAALQECADPLFGLHAGESLNIGAAGLIAQIVQSSATVRQALEACCEFALLGCRALPMQLHEKQEGVFVSVTPDPLWLRTAPEAVKQTIDGVLAFTLREYQSLVHFKHRPLALHLRGAAPKNTAEYQRIFACPLVFNAEVDGLLLPHEMVRQPIDSANYELLILLVKFAQEKIASIDQVNDFEPRVRNAILSLMQPQLPSVDAVAAHLNVSVRTLQRRLKEQQSSFRAVLENLRDDFALQYLRKPDLAVAEVADLLQYTDTANFTRAFKRRHNLTPTQWRKQQRVT